MIRRLSKSELHQLDSDLSPAMIRLLDLLLQRSEVSIITARLEVHISNVPAAVSGLSAHLEHVGWYVRCERRRDPNRIGPHRRISWYTIEALPEPEPAPARKLAEARP